MKPTTTTRKHARKPKPKRADRPRRAHPGRTVVRDDNGTGTAKRKVSRKSTHVVQVSSDETVPAPTSVTYPILKPPPRELHAAIVSRPVVTPAYIRAAQSLLDALGGEQVLIEAIGDLSDAKAMQLVERMRSPSLASEPFAQKLVLCDVRMDVLLRMFTEGRRGRAVARITADVDEVLLGIANRAKDKVVRCSACRNGGWELDEDTGEQTDTPCWTCEGTGWALREADTDAVKTYLELTGLSIKSPSVSIDASRTFNQQNNGGQVFVGNGNGNPTGPPEIAGIIRRLDQQVITLPERAASADPLPAITGQRSVNDAMEAEVVER